MSDILRGVLGGGWSLIVGWIVPTGINALLFVLFVLPSVEGAARIDVEQKTLAILVVTVAFGLLLNALQTPLFRILEGYLGWPNSLFDRGRRRQLRIRQGLSDRIEALELLARERAGKLDEQESQRLANLRSDKALARLVAGDRNVSATQRALLREQLRRFPVDPDQVVPTMLGNAIRRLEEYGYQRYQLDSQVFWNELSGVVPDQVRRQVDIARAGVDFFVCLLYGHIFTVIVAFAVLATAPGRTLHLLIVMAALLCLVPVWYRLAIVGTDEWTASVRAMVNLGRKPLAEAVGLRLPPTLVQERQMWSLLSKLSRLPYNEKAAALDQFRIDDTPSSEAHDSSLNTKGDCRSQPH